MDTNVAVQLVLAEEIQRQKRTPGEVSRSAGIGKNTLAKVSKGAKMTVPTLWAVTDALGVPMPEFAFRVDQRRKGRHSSEAQDVPE